MNFKEQELRDHVFLEHGKLSDNVNWALLMHATCLLASLRSRSPVTGEEKSLQRSMTGNNASGSIAQVRPNALTVNRIA